MKVKNIWVILSLAVSAVSCSNGDEEANLQAVALDMKESIDNLNHAIPSLQTIITKMEDGVYATNMAAATDNAYTIDFLDATSVRLDNKESALLVGVDKDSDNKYYWTQTISGESTWLLDASGNKAAVSGATGYPQIKIDESNVWTVSYDNGNTYTKVLDASGNPISLTEDNKNQKAPFLTSAKTEDEHIILTLASNGEKIEIPYDAHAVIGISDKDAGETPSLTEEGNLNIPQPAFYFEEGSDNEVLCMSLTGIQIPETDEWMKLYGTGEAGQNIWLEVDGEPKAITVINGEDMAQPSRRNANTSSRAKADIVFLVDNSSSMSEEANAIAEEITEWSETLSQTMDVRFGCVGSSTLFVNGAIDITTVENLHSYLNDRGVSGTSRTQGFAEKWLEDLVPNYGTGGSSYDECGGIMLHFADENFTFRPGANRIYIHFTDEPNYPNKRPEWSVESVHKGYEHYDWGSTRGTIHVVFSNTSSYKDETYSWSTLTKENPRNFAKYTGGTWMDVPSTFQGVSLDDLKVTGAITNSYIIRMNVTTDMLTGKHTVRIVIKSENGDYQAEMIYTDVEFTH